MAVRAVAAAAVMRHAASRVEVVVMVRSVV